jgi:hypothetical protein
MQAYITNAPIDRRSRVSLSSFFFGRTHARTHAHTHTHTKTLQFLYCWLYLSTSVSYLQKAIYKQDEWVRKNLKIIWNVGCFFPFLPLFSTHLFLSFCLFFILIFFVSFFLNQIHSFRSFKATSHFNLEQKPNVSDTIFASTIRNDAWWWGQRRSLKLWRLCRTDGAGRLLTCYYF